ncbi:uncharacterized protein LOC107980514 [Nasonia vitripennis]|uniref:MADF domain-containing protein n=1 Tax=Nasonia vitripennis TaxID=7425 RepID=A0A7M7M1J3_NASVI|nr:uncharacterized protein LOC107980514 [Nasonia vitripennis]
MVRSRPTLYDKSLEEYHTEFRDARKNHLEHISNTILEIFGEKLSVEAIIKIWQNLVIKFKEQHNLIKQYCPSGSGKENTEKVKWQFYDSMIWILPFIGHLPQLASDADTLKPQQKNPENTIDQNKFNKKKTSKSDTEKVISDMQKILDDNAKMLEAVEDKVRSTNVENSEKEKAIQCYMLLISKGFKQIPENKKFKCCRIIMASINDFKQKQT